MSEHPQERCMWGPDAAIGTSFYWNINHKVLRSGAWVFDIPYSCGNEEFARQQAEKMAAQTAMNGRHLYREVSVSGPYISWREVWWKYRDEERGGRLNRPVGAVVKPEGRSA